MKKVVIFIILSLMLITGCNNTEEKNEVAYKTISSLEAYNMMQNDKELLVIDVRSSEEYKEGHIANSINIPVNEIGNKFKEEITDDLNKTILIYCRSGARAKQASELLVDLGYNNIINFGGIITWEFGLVTE